MQKASELSSHTDPPPRAVPPPKAARRNDKIPPLVAVLLTIERGIGNAPPRAQVAAARRAVALVRTHAQRDFVAPAEAAAHAGHVVPGHKLFHLEAGGFHVAAGGVVGHGRAEDVDRREAENRLGGHGG